jgi:hypothetical protein
MERHWEMLPPVQREQLEWAPTCVVWPPILQNEREVELG